MHTFASVLNMAAALTLVCAVSTLNAADAPKPGPVTGDQQALTLLNLDFPGMEGVKAAAGRGDLAGAKKAYLAFRRTASKAQLPAKDLPHPTAKSNATNPEGEEICKHIISHTYSFEPRKADMGADFNWKYNPVPQDSPKFTMEWTWCAIARTQFWRNLTEAYMRTGNEKYAREWVAQLQDFAAKNPANEKLPPNQASLWRTLECGLRINIWALCYFRILPSDSMTPEANWTYLRLMNDHAECLLTGLKREDRTGNWVTTESMGLYSISALFPEIKQAPAWRKVATDRLLTEMERAVPADGLEAELAPGYHYVTLGGFATPLEMARANNLTLPPAFENKIRSMYQAGVLIMDQNGYAPPINDSVPADAVKYAQAGIKLLGPDPLLTWAASGGKEGTAPPTSVVLPYAGFYVMRSGWKSGDTYLFFRGGPVGYSHIHEDMLNIILQAGGKTLLFDPGNYTYDHSDWRRNTINTAFHNTVIVDGKWQRRGTSAVPVTETVKNPWFTTPAFDYVSATYDRGYQLNVYDPKQSRPERWEGETDRSVTHTRHVLFLKPRHVLALDVLNGKGNHTFDAHFHVDAPAADRDAATGRITSRSPQGMELSLFPLAKDNLVTDIIVGQKNPLLGWYPGHKETEHRPIPTVRFRKKQSAPAIFATLLVPHQGSASQVNAEPIGTAQGELWGQQMTVEKDAYDVVISRNQKQQAITLEKSILGPVSARASGLVISQSHNADHIHAGIWNVSAFDSSLMKFSATSPASVLVVKQNGDLFVYNSDDKTSVLSVAKPWAGEVTLPGGKWIKLTPGGATEVAEPK